MKIFPYIYYRMYQWYESRNYFGKKTAYSPGNMAFRYISLLQMAVVLPLLAFIKKSLVISGLLSTNYLDSTFKSPAFWVTVAIVLFIWTYLRYGRVHPDWHEDELRHYAALNRNIRIWMLMILPVIVLLFYLVLFIFIFGGVVLGRNIDGIVH